MATPSVLTVPSMYGDGILYSGPSAYGSELVTNGDFSNGLTGWTGGTPPTLNPDSTVTFDDSGENIFRSWTDVVGTRYRIVFEGVGSIRYRTGFAGSDGTIVPINLPCEVDLLATSDTNRIQLYGPSSGTGVLKSVSIKEITQGSDFDFTRSTTGTRINEEGYIEDVPYNLVSYSENFSQFTKVNATVTTNQTLAPNGTLTADKIVFNGTANARVEQNLTASIMGTPNTESVFLKTESGTANIDIGLATHDVTTVVVTSEWKRFTHTGEGSFPRMKSDSAVTIFAWGMQVVKGDKPKNYLPTTDRLNLPRLNYPVYGGCPSLLLEPQRTNLIPYSGDFSNSSYIRTATTATGGFLSPEGNLNAYKLSEDNTNSIHRIYQTATVTSSPNATISVYVKYNGRRFVLMRIADETVGRWYDLLSGELGGIYAGTPNESSIESLANGWYRITIGHTVSSQSRFELWIQDTESISAYQGDGTSGIYIYGAQQEVGSYATSLIHTSGAAVTRNEDKAFNAGLGTTDTFNDSEGVLYAEISVLDTDSANKIITLSNGTNSTRVAIRCVNTLLIAQLRISGSNQYEFAYTLPNMTDNFKIAIKYKVNDFSLYVNGSKLDSSNSGNVFSSGTLTELAFDDGGGSSIFNGNVKAVAVYKTALTDTELANLTSYNNHDLFIPYRSRMQMISADQELQCTEHDITRFL